MTEWGPWDHESPQIRMVQSDGDSVRYSLHNVPSDTTLALEGPSINGQLSAPDGTYTISTTAPGVHPYRLRVQADGWEREIRGTLVSTTWDVTFFKWTKTTDPREDLQAWRKLAQGETAVSGRIKQLAFQYGWRGPSELGGRTGRPTATR
jgi:hypothetical protein